LPYLISQKIKILLDYISRIGQVFVRNQKSKIKITILYSDKNGQSHFEEIEMPLKDDGDIGFLSDKIPLGNNL
jgi:hypothetical protein